jgi:hypothetical protein
VHEPVQERPGRDDQRSAAVGRAVFELETGDAVAVDQDLPGFTDDP